MSVQLHFYDSFYEMILLDSISLFRIKFFLTWIHPLSLRKAQRHWGKVKLNLRCCKRQKLATGVFLLSLNISEPTDLLHTLHIKQKKLFLAVDWSTPHCLIQKRSKGIFFPLCVPRTYSKATNARNSRTWHSSVLIIL